jgi:hypothetical protein
VLTGTWDVDKDIAQRHGRFREIKAASGWRSALGLVSALFIRIEAMEKVIIFGEMAAESGGL